jgi:hypothetical protein
MRHPFNGQVGQLVIKACTISMPVSNISLQGADNGIQLKFLSMRPHADCGVVTLESLIHKKIIETVFRIRRFLGLPDLDPLAEVRIRIQNSKKNLDFYSFGLLYNTFIK